MQYENANEISNEITIYISQNLIYSVKWFFSCAFWQIIWLIYIIRKLFCNYFIVWNKRNRILIFVTLTFNFSWVLSCRPSVSHVTGPNVGLESETETEKRQSQWQWRGSTHWWDVTSSELMRTSIPGKWRRAVLRGDRWQAWKWIWSCCPDRLTAATENTP